MRSTGSFAFLPNFDGADEPLALAVSGGVQRREDVLMGRGISGSFWTTEIPGIDASGWNLQASGETSCAAHIQTVTLSTGLGREELFELGRRGPTTMGKYPNWDLAWREQLAQNLGVLVRQLWEVGINEIFVDGSFVDGKEHPNDIDGYFVLDDFLRLATGTLERELNRLDPHKVWTWDVSSRRPYKGSRKRYLPMWHVYRVEFYIHCPGMPLMSSGIGDELGNEPDFPSLFRRSRIDSHERGIVKIER